GEEEQPVLEQRTGEPTVHLGEVRPVAAAADVGRRELRRVFMFEDTILGVAAHPFRFEGQLHAAMELVAAGTDGRVDDAAGAATEFDRITAGLDLELVEESERRGGTALAPVDVGDVQAIDV